MIALHPTNEALAATGPAFEVFTCDGITVEHGHACLVGFIRLPYNEAFRVKSIIEPDSYVLAPGGSDRAYRALLATARAAFSGDLWRPRRIRRITAYGYN